jgi:para-nitrobenzyl esterase
VIGWPRAAVWRWFGRVAAAGAAVIGVVTCSASADHRVAVTEGGPVAGVVDDGVVVYKGIPFAAPPVGSLRWRPPQPVKPWKAVLAADSYKPQCPQLGPPLPGMPVEKNSEDCLYLNLWVPARAAPRRRAVMVYLYGGGLRKGSASTPLYWGDELARHEDVIVVNLAYRLGPLGFLAHPELSAESAQHVSGNYGLLDMVAGLQWVRNNITAFGGDPANVTLFGQSAGSWSINKLMISPLARGLFQKAIGESAGDMGPAGTHEGMPLLPAAEKVGVAFTNSLGAHSIADLRRISAEEITAAKFSGLPDVDHYDGGVAIVDGYVIPSDTYALYASGKQADIPLLVGYNADEDEKVFRWQMWAWATVHARTSHSRVYFYRFTGQHSYHGAELPYVFMMPLRSGGRGWPAGDPKIAEVIAAYWTNFAKTANPNGAGLPTWPALDDQHEVAMSLGREFVAGPMPDLAEHQRVDAYMNSLR